MIGDDIIYVTVFFFFQAEDGIRDIGVTGVQTCALPIWDPDRALRAADGRAGAAGGDAAAGAAGRPVDARPGSAGPARPRSEERRVGKECRSRWSPDY